MLRLFARMAAINNKHHLYKIFAAAIIGFTIIKLPYKTTLQCNAFCKLVTNTGISPVTYKVGRFIGKENFIIYRYINCICRKLWMVKRYDGIYAVTKTAVEIAVYPALFYTETVFKFNTVYISRDNKLLPYPKLI